MRRFGSARPMTIRSPKQSALMRVTARLVRDDGGQIAIMFAVALTALLLFTGVALDYQRASSAKTSLQNASDAIVLALGREAANDTPTDTLKQMATSRLAAMLPGNYTYS